MLRVATSVLVIKKKDALSKTEPKEPCQKEPGCTFFKAGTVAGD